MFLKHPDADVHIEDTGIGKNKINVDLLNKDLFMPYNSWETNYSVELIKKILELKGPAYLCDEIMRDESEDYIQLNFKYDILGYLDLEEFKGKRILDFACGSGASTMVLARMFPKAEIVGIELEEKFIKIAKERQKFYGLDNIEFHISPDANSLPQGIGMFDYIVFSAVFEHLLPAERKELLPKIWKVLKSDGIMFVDQTPDRRFPIEIHTTNLPLINYLPSKLALPLVHAFSKRKQKDVDWQTLLRRGIRGGTPEEILKILKIEANQPILLKPTKMGLKSRADLWYQYVKEKNPNGYKKFGFSLIRFFNYLPVICILPDLSLAIKKN